MFTSIGKREREEEINNEGKQEIINTKLPFRRRWGFSPLVEFILRT